MDNERKLLMTLNYTISVDEFDKAFLEIQKKYTYPLHAVYTFFTAAIAAYNAYLFVKNPNNNICWVIIAVALGFIFTLWYNPVKRRRSLREALSQIEDDNYVNEIYDDGMTIATVQKVNPETGETEEAIAPKKIFYETGNVVAIEKNDIFIVYIKKQMFYVIPKSALDEEQIKTLREQFGEKMKKFYPEVK